MRISRTFLLLILIILPLMLYAGLTRKGYDPANNLSWEPEGGLTFRTRSVAYTDRGITLPDGDVDFALEMRVRPDYPRRPVFQVLFLIHDGNSWNQLVVGQWDKSLVIMNGVDFNNRRRTPKLYVPLGEGEGIREIRIESGTEGTRVYLDGAWAESDRDLILRFPPNRKSARLLLGNSIWDSNPWSGTCYDVRLTAGSLAWEYDFSRPGGEILAESAGRSLPLRLSPRRPVLIKSFLQRPRLWELRRGVYQWDMFVNFFGFLPLGVLLYRLLRGRKRCRCLLSLALVFLFSLFLETVQVWIPSRDSSLLDLMLNTAGGAAGIYLMRLIFPVRKKG